MKTVTAFLLALMLTGCGTVYVPQYKEVKTVIPAAFFSSPELPKPPSYENGLTCSRAYSELSEYTLSLLDIIGQQRRKLTAVRTLLEGEKDGE